MTIIGTAFVAVRPDAAGFAKETQSTLDPQLRAVGEQAGARLGAGMDKGLRATKFDGLTESLQKATDRAGEVGRKLTTRLTLPLVAGLGVSVKMASDLNETVSKSAVVFGTAAKQVDAFGDTAAKGLGQSKRQALEAASAFGNLFKGIGFTDQKAADASIQLTKLASDLSSFQNTSPEDAIQALTSALVGESEPIRRYGVLLNEASISQEALASGLITTAKEMTPQIKAQATLNLIMKQTVLSQGDFARTAGGLANQQRILRASLEDTAASIGTKLLPTALSAAKGLAGALDQFNQLPDEAQKAVVVLGLVLAAAGPVASAFSGVGKAIEGTTAAVGRLGAAGTVSVSAIGVGVALLAKAFLDSRVQADRLVESITKDVKVNDLQSLVKAQNAAADAANKAAVSNERFSGFLGRVAQGAKGTLEAITPMNNTVLNNIAVNEKAGKAAKDLGDQYARFQTNLAALGAQFRLSQDDVLRLANAQGIDLSGAVDKTTTAFAAALDKQKALDTVTGKLADSTGTLTSKVTTSEEKIKAYADSVDKAIGPTLRLHDADRDFAARLNDVADAFDLTEEKADAYQKSLNRLLGGTLDVNQAHRDLIDARDDLAASIGENGTKVGFATKQERDLQAALDGTVQAARDEVAALTAAGRIAPDAASQQKALLDRLADLKLAFPELKPAIDTYARAVSVANDTAVGVADTQAKISATLDQIVAAATARVGALVEAGRVGATAAAQHAALVAQLEEVRKKFPQLGPGIDEYIGKLKAIPGVVSTTIELKVPPPVQIGGNLVPYYLVRPDLLSPYGLGSEPARMSGGPGVAGGMWVGENGPEWWQAPRGAGSGEIIPNHRAMSMAMMGASASPSTSAVFGPGSIVVEVHGAVTDGDLRRAGDLVGSGIGDALTRRDIAVSVRVA